MTTKKVTIIFFSKTGNIKKMAEAIGAGLKNESEKSNHIDVNITDIDKVQTETLVSSNCIIAGAPIHYGKLATPMENFLKESFLNSEVHRGKIGSCFTSYGVDIEGSEIAILTMVQIFLEHGMLVPGFGDGPLGQFVAGALDEQVLANCNDFGKNIADLTKRLKTSQQ